MHIFVKQNKTKRTGSRLYNNRVVCPLHLPEGVQAVQKESSTTKVLKLAAGLDRFERQRSLEYVFY